MLLLACIVLAVLLVCTAWLSDDCFFTLRTVQQLLLGRGPRWNAFERVQAYTHPLWMLVLTGAIGITREYCRTTILVSLAVSGGACIGLVRCSASRAQAVLALVLLIASRAFVDFSTGGLENPLSHLLAVGALACVARPDPGRRGLFRASLVAGLAAVNRLDSVLLFLPLVAARLWSGLRRGAKAEERFGFGRALAALVLGFLPLIAWEAFSCLYYGFPFPNTAYAKLGAGVESVALARQGGLYLLETLRRDPVTLAGILAGLLVAARRTRRGEGALGVGIALYLVYVVRIGGDFMLGRFLALPFFLGVGLNALSGPKLATPVLASLLGAVTLAAPWLHKLELLGAADAAPYVKSGIGDERCFYHRTTGLLRTSSGLGGCRASASPDVYRPTPFRMWFGRAAFEAGPDVLALEAWGLADPLLARLPARFGPWRIGHFGRHLPPGYAATLRTGENQLRDPGLARYHELLRFVTRGPLLDVERLRTAFALSLGRYDGLIDRFRCRFARLPTRNLVEQAPRRWALAQVEGRLQRNGLRLLLPRPMRVQSIALVLASGGLRRVELLRAGERVWSAASLMESSLKHRPDRIADALWLVPLGNTRLESLELTCADP